MLTLRAGMFQQWVGVGKTTWIVLQADTFRRADGECQERRGLLWKITLQHVVSLRETPLS